MQLILIALGAWFIAQIIKFSLRAFDGQPNFRLFYQSGGMPSAHSATVVALAVGALTTLGYQSPVFGLSVVIAAIVIYDSLGVRRASGEQSVMMNMLLKAAGNKAVVREILGHTPAEVAAGSAVGVFTGLLFTYGHWSPYVSWLAERPGELERYIYLAIFAGFVAFAFAARIFIRKYRAVAVMYQLRSVIWNAVALPGLLGGIISLLQFQTSRAGSWRIWAVILLCIFAIVHIILALRLYRYVKTRYREQSHKLKLHRKQQRQLEKKTKKTKRRK